MKAKVERFAVGGFVLVDSCDVSTREQARAWGDKVYLDSGDYVPMRLVFGGYVQEYYSCYTTSHLESLYRAIRGEGPCLTDAEWMAQQKAAKAA